MESSNYVPQGRAVELGTPIQQHAPRFTVRVRRGHLNDGNYIASVDVLNRDGLSVASVSCRHFKHPEAAAQIIADALNAANAN